MDRLRRFHRQLANSPAAHHRFPPGQRIPFFIVIDRVFKRTVLDQFGVKPAIRGIIEILEKNADEVGTDWFASVGLNRYGGYLRVDQRGAGDR